MNDDNGLCTSTWGSPGWFFLHCVAAGYPVDPDVYDEGRGNARGHTRRAYTNFFKNTGHVLPCRFCRESYASFVAETPIEKYIHSRKTLFEWLFIIHNRVNEKLGDKQETNLEAVVDKYERFRASCKAGNIPKKGCTQPADKKIKMKCRLVIEPANSTRNRRVVFWIVVTIIGVVLLMSLRKTNTLQVG